VVIRLRLSFKNEEILIEYKKIANGWCEQEMHEISKKMRIF
jgi:hypothetical protein